VTAPDAPEGARPPHRLGTFGGVFTPSLLTILGVILFLRFGMLTGTLGLDRAIVMVLLGNAVSVLTSLSLSAIATNRRVHGGGDYHLVSRSLGLEFGGAIGLVLFFAQSVSVGFYVAGFTEALSHVAGGFALPTSVLGVALPEAVASLPPAVVTRLVASAVVVVLLLVAHRGAALATRFQYAIMAALGLALLAFFAGATASFDPARLEENRSRAPGGLPFWDAFAIFFPAITGFTQGVSMSGELRDPARSLPRGTFLAVAVSGAVYLAMPVMLAGSLDRTHLLHDAGAGALERVAWAPALITVGVFAATLSSALASLVGAPRILQAMGRDRLLPGLGFFAAGSGPEGEPRVATGLTALIALACVWAGDLDALAGLVTMFFLLSYAALNYATFVESYSRNPSFRPRIRLAGWRTSLVGAAVCVGVMVAIDPVATAVALVVLGAVHRLLVGRRLVSPGGDARRAYYVQRIKLYLLKLRGRPEHARDWRPVVLAVARPGGPVVRFAEAIGGEQGIVTFAEVLVGPLEGLVAERERRLAELQASVGERAGGCFFEVPVADSFAEGVRSLLLSHGLGQLRPNTLLLDWSADLGDEYVEVLRDAASLRCNVVLLHPGRPPDPFSEATEGLVPAPARRVDVWWRGRENGSLALLLAHLVSVTDAWRDSDVRLLRIVADDAAKALAETEMAALLESSRIEATPVVVRSTDPPFDVVARESGDSHLVFLGIGGILAGGRADLLRYNAVLARLPCTALVSAWGALDVEV
jgi:amino acid transporter